MGQIPLLPLLRLCLKSRRRVSRRSFSRRRGVWGGGFTLTRESPDPRIVGWFQWEAGRKGVYGAPEVFPFSRIDMRRELTATYGSTLRRHLAAVGLPTGLGNLSPRAWNARRVIAHMARDKKVRDGKVAFVLTHGIGRAMVTDSVTPDQLIEVLEEVIAA